MTENYDANKEMYSLLLKEGSGVLSTISLAVEGYPFGSVVPYCLDQNLRPFILISSIAQHTKNINENSKVSLTIIESNTNTNKQSKGRLTFIGDAEKISAEDKSQWEEYRQKYLNYFPEAVDYFGTHDFEFYRILPKRLRFIGGFGKIYWVEKEDFHLRNIFSQIAESQIVNHMNEDHKYNQVDYCRHYLSEIITEEDVFMTGLDQWGMDLNIQGTLKRIDFPRVLKDPSEVRSIMVEMAKISKS